MSSLATFLIRTVPQEAILRIQPASRRETVEEFTTVKEGMAPLFQQAYRPGGCDPPEQVGQQLAVLPFLVATWFARIIKADMIQMFAPS